jgi:hypothetical protein
MLKNLYRTFFLLSLLGCLGASSSFSWLFPTTNSARYGSGLWLQREMQIIKLQANNIDNNVLRLGLMAFLNARKKGYAGKPILTVIDYSKPSNQRRLWVFDLQRNKTLFNTWVSHGKNSGGINATSFSNNQGSLKSSIGLFVTGEPYVGGNGYSLRLKGLESGINDNALRRHVVIHGAWYANPDMIGRNGQLGRSWGCPAVKTELAKPLINTIKEKSLVFAYYPDRRWLSNSQFLAA